MLLCECSPVDAMTLWKPLSPGPEPVTLCTQTPGSRPTNFDEYTCPMIVASYHFAVYLRYMIQWLCLEYGTRILANIQFRQGLLLNAPCESMIRPSQRHFSVFNGMQSVRVCVGTYTNTGPCVYEYVLRRPYCSLYYTHRTECAFIADTYATQR